MTSQDRSPLDLADHADGTTLPGEAYTSEAVLAWELEHLFDRSWVCAGRPTDLCPSPGAQAAVRTGSEAVLVVRDDDGAVRVFYDVCRHRGHELLAVGASVEATDAIHCPYHGWRYGLDGGRGPTGGLVPVPAVDWHGWLFVNPAGAATVPFADHGAGLDAVVAPYDPGRLVRAAVHHYEVAANWKLVVENYHECYHCASIHPELCRVSPPESGVGLDGAGAWVGGPMRLADGADTMSFDGRAGARPLPGVAGDQRRQVQYIGLLPNLLLSLHPDYVMTHRIEPIAPGRTHIECSWLFDPDTVAEAGFDPAYAVEFWDRTNGQDWRACESVQRGVASRGYRPGPLTARESDVRQFLALITAAHRS